MPTLASQLRNQLERVVIEARDVAEAGARAALEALAVHHHEPYGHMKADQRKLRNHLRARARQLGDRQDSSGRLAIDHLAGECAYEHWHRMLFARFLAENGLLIEPEMGVAMSLTEAEELAKDEGVDVWVFASRCAQRMLPQIFRPDDPLLQIGFATERMVELERLLNSLPPAVFAASDALGWVYQFWQSKRKDEVNRSEVKIGADEISAVTQLFTEPYMVEFLLHNTLGAWWAGKQLSDADAAAAKSEDELRRKLALPGVGWEYLRFVRGDDGEGGPWRPAAGTFDGWPKAAAELRVLDPCCGSGHFLVAALHHLVPVRMAEEGLSAADAVEAVLRDNVHGLEIDERCCQIAAFALAFAAWTYPDAGGYRELPDLHVACTGIGPQSTQEQWVKLAEESGVPMPTVGREAIKNGLLNLHRLFSQAPTLGSLISPAELPGELIAADYETIQPYLTAIRKIEKADNETRERAIAAAGMVKAADLLADDYTLIITNVPYLGRKSHDDLLRAWGDLNEKDAKSDLATMFVSRSLSRLARNGSMAVVTPQGWLLLTTYRRMRERLLRHCTWNTVARLGPGAFETIGGHVVNVALTILTADVPPKGTVIGGVEASDAKSPPEKAKLLRDGPATLVPQAEQLENPDATISLQSNAGRTYLREYASCSQGLSTGDDLYWRRQFWELPVIDDTWATIQTPSHGRGIFAGREGVVHRDFLTGDDHTGVIRGRDVWSQVGVAIDRVGSVSRSLYFGDVFHSLSPVIVPKSPKNRLAVAAFCLSDEFVEQVRSTKLALNLSNGYLEKLPFDLDYWQRVAAKKYPDGLPEPESDDPTQWVFHGYPYEASEDTMLHVAVARLLGYRWPAELDDKMRLSKRARALVKKCAELAKFADKDGIVCIPAVRGEDPAAERLLKLLAACDIEPGADLDGWLRNEFFQEHCEMFHHRPFVWHIWDGRKRDGFHALVNYHKLCEGDGKGRKLLESLTYSRLGDWITRCRDEVKRGEGGAEDRLAAAVALQDRLKAIIAGEPPFDLFARWTPLHEQPIGWEPDINDGVRINIRPFLAADLPNGRKGAGVLRYKPNIHWKKDRGKEPDRLMAEYPWFWGWDQKTLDFAGKGKKPDGNRWNDCHYTTKAKQAAREATDDD